MSGLFLVLRRNHLYGRNITSASYRNSIGCLQRSKQIYTPNYCHQSTATSLYGCTTKDRENFLLEDTKPTVNVKLKHNFSTMGSATCRRKHCNNYGITTKHQLFLPYNERITSLRGTSFFTIFKSNFSQQIPVEETVKSGIPVAATLKPLSMKDIKPVLKPEEKSKVEETCETLKAKEQAKTSQTLLEVVDDALQRPKKDVVEPAKKTIMQRIVHEVKHYANGFRLLFINMRISLKQLWKILHGQDLTRRERKLFLRTVSDIFRLLPFMVFLIIPFMEFLIPVALKVFPNMLPSTFEDKTTKDKARRQQLKMKLSMAKFLQDTVEEMAVSAEDTKNREQTMAFYDFIEKIRSNGEQPSNKDIIKFSKLFEDEITLGNMTYEQLKAINRMLMLPSYGSRTYLRFQLNMKLRQLRADDVLIQKEGIDSLTVSELQSACMARGMRALGVPEARLKSQLSQWLELHLGEHVPASLLLMSRALYVPENVASPVDQLKTALSTLSEDAVEEAEILVAELAGEEADPKTKIDVLKKEELLCEEERVEEEEIKKEDLKRKELFERTQIMEAREILFNQMELLQKPSPFLRKDDEEFSKEEWKTLGQSWKDSYDADKEDLHKIREDRDEYQEELRELRAIDLKNTLKESAASMRIGKKVDKMIEQLSHELDDFKEETAFVLDQDRDGVITTQEFCNYMKGGEGCPKATKMEKIAKILDEDHDGKISVADLNKVLDILAEQGMDMKEKQLIDIIHVVTREKKAERLAKDSSETS